MNDAEILELKKKYEGRLARLTKTGYRDSDAAVLGIVSSIEHYAYDHSAAGVRFVEEPSTLWYFGAHDWILELHPGQEGAQP